MGWPDACKKVAGFNGRDSSKPNQLPLGTAKLGVVEAAGALAVGTITGSDPILLEAQLRAYHLSKGLQKIRLLELIPVVRRQLTFQKLSLL